MLSEELAYIVYYHGKKSSLPATYLECFLKILSFIKLYKAKTSEASSDKYPSGKQKNAGSTNMLFVSICEPIRVAVANKKILTMNNKAEALYLLI